MKMNDTEVFEYYSQYITKINSKLDIRNSKFYVFRAPFAQPIFDKEFLKNKPDFKTPVPNFFVANLDMTYPYDRGTNYAVRLGKQVADMITSP
jgi:protoporphyrinogen oxidase